MSSSDSDSFVSEPSVAPAFAQEMGTRVCDKNCRALPNGIYSNSWLQRSHGFRINVNAANGPDISTLPMSSMTDRTINLCATSSVGGGQSGFALKRSLQPINARLVSDIIECVLNSALAAYAEK